jgi:hypothetical protein
LEIWLSLSSSGSATDAGSPHEFEWENAGMSLIFTESPANTDLSFQVFSLLNLKTPIYSTDALPFFPGIITDDFTVRRNASKEVLSDVVLADLGDSTAKSPYLIVS